MNNKTLTKEDISLRKKSIISKMNDKVTLQSMRGWKISLAIFASGISFFLAEHINSIKYFTNPTVISQKFNYIVTSPEMNLTTYAIFLVFGGLISIPLFLKSFNKFTDKNKDYFKIYALSMNIVIFTILTLLFTSFGQTKISEFKFSPVLFSTVNMARNFNHLNAAKKEVFYKNLKNLDDNKNIWFTNKKINSRNNKLSMIRFISRIEHTAGVSYSANIQKYINTQKENKEIASIFSVLFKLSSVFFTLIALTVFIGYLKDRKDIKMIKSDTDIAQ